jgi:UDP-2,3-diacylglucosamine pyrophosphatase LpxH
MQQKYRTIWLSDIHLGSKGCQADKLLTFLKHTESEYLFLVGDIIDFWSLKRTPYWPSTHNTVVQKILKKSRHDTKVIFIPGNHDEPLRDYIGLSFGNITLYEDYTHTLANGKTVFCLHGDIYDVITRYHKWLAVLGDVGYTFLLWLNHKQNIIRSLLGMDYWSLSAFIKHRIKEAVSFISDYENNVVKEASHLGVDAVLCGHIHHPEIRMIDNVLYINTGDYVESCSAIAETHDGELVLLSMQNSKLIEVSRFIF